MSWNHYGVWCGVSLFALFGSNGVALAQQASATNEAPLAEIVVTAEKRSEKIQDVPVAVTVVTGQQLAEQHIYSIADLSRTTPALEMVQAFGGPGGGGQIRGIGTNSFSPTAEGAVGMWWTTCLKATSTSPTSLTCSGSSLERSARNLVRPYILGRRDQYGDCSAGSNQVHGQCTCGLL